MFDPKRAKGLSAVYELRIGENTFRAIISDGELDITRNGGGRPDAIITTDSNTFAGMVYGDLHLEHALSSGVLKIEGDADKVEDFLTLFPLPEPAGE